MAVYDPRGGGNVHIDRVLSNVSVGYPNNGFVAEEFILRVNVQKQSDKYYVFGYETWGQEPGEDVRAPGAPAMEIPGIQVSTEPYFAVEHAQKIMVTDEERENADSPLRPDSDGAELVTARILLGKELVAKTLITTAANFQASNTTTLAGAARWDQYATSTPISDMKTGKRAIHADLFMEPTKALIPWNVMSFLEDHPDIIERIKYSQRGVLTQEIIAQVFGIGQVVVPGAGYNTANLNQTVSLSYIWGDDVLMAFVPARPGLKVPAFAYEFNWNIAGMPRVSDRWRDTDRVGDYIRVRTRYDLRMIATDASDDSIAGYLIKDVLT